MDTKFNADEVFEMAEQIERDGAMYYRRAAEIFSDKKVCDLLAGLAKMEEDHEAIFAKMRAQFIKREFKQAVDDTNEESALYIRAFADNKVFDTRKSPSELLTGEETLHEMVMQAIDAEKNSIVFYMAVKAMVPKEWGREFLDVIIREEMKHINLLVTIDNNFKTHE